MGTAAFRKRQSNENAQLLTSSITPTVSRNIPLKSQYSDNLASSVILPKFQLPPISEQYESMAHETFVERTLSNPIESTVQNDNNMDNNEVKNEQSNKSVSEQRQSRTMVRNRIPVNVLQKMVDDLNKTPNLKPKCPSIILVKEFIDSLKWPNTLFDPAHDQCCCKSCYPVDREDVITAGNGRYVIPRGWVRLGLRVDPIITNEHDIWNEWIVTFHGTTKIAARSILTHRHFYVPGDKLIDGTILGIREGHIPDQRFIFTSPTIAYSSLRVYAPIYPFYSNQNDTHYNVQLVLQCRQRPGSFKVQGETVGAKSTQICPFIPNNVIEYFTDVRASIVAYGLLVRMSEKSSE